MDESFKSNNQHIIVYVDPKALYMILNNWIAFGVPPKRVENMRGNRQS